MKFVFKSDIQDYTGLFNEIKKNIKDIEVNHSIESPFGQMDFYIKAKLPKPNKK